MPQSLKALELSNAFGFIFKNEVHALRFLASLMPDNALCLNIGAGTGTSTMAFLEARPDLTKTFWSIDIEGGVNPLGGLGNERYALENAGMMVPNQIVHDSHSVDYPLYMNMAHPSFDYVFIDGDHTYEGCMADFDNVHPFCHGGTIVAFHDYDSVHWHDVHTCVQDIIKKTGARTLLHIDTVYAIIL